MTIDEMSACLLKTAPCPSGKARHVSVDAAYRTLLDIIKRNKSAFADTDVPQPYHCKQCGLWHIGRDPSLRRGES